MSDDLAKEFILELFNIIRNSALHMAEGVEQVAHLLYLKLLDEEEDRRLSAGRIPLFEGSAYRYRWRCWSSLPASEMAILLQDGVFPYLASLIREDSHVGDYFRSVKMTIHSPHVLAAIVETLGRVRLLDLTDTERGRIFEHLLAGMEGFPGGGDSSTPLPLRRLMVTLAEPTTDDSILDPCCGFAGVLAECVSTSNERRGIVSEHFFNSLPKQRLRGIEISWPSARLARLNMIFHGFKGTEITCGNALTSSGALGEDELRRGFSLVLANPPFGRREQIELIRPEIGIRSQQSEALFLDLAMRALAEGGRAVVVVTEGVLFGSSEAQVELRRQLLENSQLLAVISLATRAFSPHSSVRASILVFRKPFKDQGIHTHRVWFYELQSKAMTKSRIEEDYGAGSELVTAWNKYASNDFQIPPGVQTRETLKADAPEPLGWWADFETIQSNGYALTVSRYKPHRDEPCVDPAEVQTRLVQQLAELQIAAQNWYSPVGVLQLPSRHSNPRPLSDITLDVPSINPASEPETFFDYVEISGFDRDQHVVKTAKRIQGKDIPPRSRRRLRTGDVLISTVRPSAAGVAIVSEKWDGAIASGDICVLRAKTSAIAPEFLLHLCLDSSFIRQISAASGGATIPRVPESEIKGTIVHVPPLLSQQLQLVETLAGIERLGRAASGLFETTKELQQAIRTLSFQPAVSSSNWDQ